MKKIITHCYKTPIILIMLLASCILTGNVYADRPQPNLEQFTEAQKIKWSIYSKTVSPSIYQQSCIMYDKKNNEVDWRQGITDLAVTVVTSTLEIKSVLNPDISDLQLLSSALGVELDFIGVISGWEIGDIIQDGLMAGIQTCLGNPAALESYCATHLVSAVVDFYDAFQLWELSKKINLSTALNDLMWNYYAFAGNTDEIKNYYNISASDCEGTYTDFDCIVHYFSQTQKVDYEELSDGARGVLRYVNAAYVNLTQYSTQIPSKPELHEISSGVNPDNITFSWSGSDCENCGEVNYNLEIHKEGQPVFKADAFDGHLISATSYKLPISLDPNTTYYWAVFPKSQYGIWNLDAGSWPGFTTGGDSSNMQPSAFFTVSLETGFTSANFKTNAGNSTDIDGDPLEYSWNWGDSSDFSQWSLSATAAHQYQQAGNYEITLRVRDDEAESYYSKTVLVTTEGASPLEVTNLSPYNDVQRQPVDTKISWSNGGGATSYDMYFGKDSNFVSQNRINQVSETYDPGTLEYNTIYYFRVDAVNAQGTTIGDTWHFTTQSPPPWLGYYYWDFDTSGTEGWTARNSTSEGIYNSDYWIIDPTVDAVSKSGIVSISGLTTIHTDNYDTIEVRAAVKNEYIETFDAYVLIGGQWLGPISLDYVSGAQTANAQCVYQGAIGYTGQIQQLRVDFAWGSDTEDDRVYIDYVKFLQRNDQENTISGYVRDTNGFGIPNVTMNFSNNGGSATTDNAGYYSNAVPEGWSGTVTPYKLFYSFAPASQTYSNVTSAQSQNFTGTPPVNTDSGTYYSGDGTHNDGFVINHGFDQYATIQSASTGTEVSNPAYTTMLTVGQDKADSGEYYVYRASIPFDTNSLLDNCTITGATLYLYGYGPDYSYSDFDMEIVQSNQASSGNLALSDYGNFGSISGGSLNTSSWQGYNGVNTIEFNATGLGWINKNGVTFIGFRSSRDVKQTEPTQHEFLNIWSSESGSSYKPYLVVEYAEESPASSVNGSPMPDTGQTICYDAAGNVITCPQPGEAFYGQDAQYAGPVRSYTKLGQNGIELPDTATEADGWIMTRDNVTGLIWEVKTDDGSIHDKDNTYTWYDTEDFINTLNADNFGGYSDWRMPTVEELSSLVNSGMYNDAIDSMWFPYTMSSNWSSTTSASNTDLAWLVYFRLGHVYGDNKSSSYYVRAVRAEQSGLLDNFVDNDNGTVTDTETGLMWQKETAPSKYTWQESLAYAEGLSLGGHSDWRLPNRNELQTLVDYSRYNRAIDPLLEANTWSSAYWSSTTIAGNTVDAWLVGFYDGGAYYGDKSLSWYVRAVRAGQAGSLGDSVTNPSIDSGTTGISGKPALDWDDVPGATTYDLYIWKQGDTKPGTPTVAGLTESQYAVQAGLLPLTTYYWQVIAKNSSGETIGPEWTFTTMEIIAGNINGDGYVDLTDAIPALQICAGITPAQTIWVEADINNDGRIGLAEALYILQTVAGLRAGIHDSGGIWTTKTDMPTARDYLTACSFNEKIYAIGGLIYGDVIIDTVEEYNPATNTWATKAPMPTARKGAASAVVNGKIYVFGGMVCDPDGSAWASEKTEVYDPENNTWQTRTDMPTARNNPSAAAVGGKIYVIGGINLATVDEYDPSSNMWTSKTPMPTARSQHFCMVIGGKIYVIGGADSLNNGLDTVEQYDPTTNTWTSKAAMTTARRGLTAGVINDRIYAVGGSDGVQLDTVEEYDPSTNTWAPKTSMPTKRVGLASGVVNGKLYAIGGWNNISSTYSERFLSVVEEYTP